VRRSITLLAGAAVIAAALSGPAFSQGTPQTLSLMKVDPQSVATGYRTSKVVGSTVVNETNETADDLVVTPGEKVLSRCCQSATSLAWARNTLWCLTVRSKCATRK
jgi:hypothetical protein